MSAAPEDVPCHRVVNRSGGLCDAFRPMGRETQRLLLEMVYFRRSHSLYGAAAYLGIPERTAHRWNAKMLYALAEELGYFDDSADDRPYLPRKTRL